MSNIKEIVIDLRDWTEHYPTGAIIYFEDETEDSDFCDTFTDFVIFLGKYKENIISETNIDFKINVADIGTSNVMDLVKEISEFIGEIRNKGL